MRRFWIDTTLCTVFIFMVMWGVSGLADLKLMSAFDPISAALSDFDLSDFAFAEFRQAPDPEEMMLKDKIVIVNFGKLGRRDMSAFIDIINKYEPRVIGLDAFYNCEGGHYNIVDCPQLGDTLGNLMLAGSFQQVKNLVMVSKLLQSDSMVKSQTLDVYDSMETSDEMFSMNTHYGFANLVTGAKYQEDIKICKSFWPSAAVKDKKQLAFAVQISMLYDSVKTKKFLARHNEEEYINYITNVEYENVKLKTEKNLELGNTDKLRKLGFLTLDVYDVLDEKFDASAIKDKIVLIGYLGEYIGAPMWEDKFFTPLNLKHAGRANPDMYGLVVHANIITTILGDKPINVLSENSEYIIAFIVCFFNVALFGFINAKWPVVYDGVSVIIQLVEIVIVSLIVIQLLSVYQIKSSLTATMAALALVGPCYDLYSGLVKAGIDKLKDLVLTRKRKKVLKT